MNRIHTLLIALNSLLPFQVMSATEPAKLSPDEAKQIAIDAYIYGYSLITTEVTRVQMTSVDEIEGLRGPMGQFINVKRYPPGDYRGVSAPNADTLYSAAWVDVGTEPVVFSHPDMGDRFYLFPMYSLWMPVIESPSQRTAGDEAATYLLTGPGWKGEGPAGMKQIKSPTKYMLILGRTYADGTEQDYEIVNSLQEQYKLVPLSSYGKSYKSVPPRFDSNPGFSLTDKPQAVISAMDLTTYFNMMAKLMGDVAPPAAEDAPMVASMAKIGLVPGEAFDLAKLDPAVRSALKDVVKAASEKIFAQKQTSGTRVNGWLIPEAAGAYGTNYLQRAFIAAFGWPANLPEDAVYPYAELDGDGQRLSGDNRYTLKFAKGQTPPVNGFWSLTMYIDDGGLWFYPNPLNKYTVSLRNNPKFNSDGSLTLYLQHESPGKEIEANWLPAPEGPFTLMLRMYWPKPEEPSVLPPGKGTWQPPAVKRAE